MGSKHKRYRPEFVAEAIGEGRALTDEEELAGERAIERAKATLRELHLAQMARLTPSAVNQRTRTCRPYAKRSTKVVVGRGKHV